MRTNVLLICLLLTLPMLAGCTGNANGDGDADPTSDASTVIINNYYNNTTNVHNNPIQDEPEWFSQGWTQPVQWDTDTVYITNPAGNETWNFTRCETNLGGTRDFVIGGGMFTTLYARCDLPLTSISTSSGQLLAIHEWSGGFSINTTCDNITMIGDGSTSTDEWRAPGSSLDCVHDVFLNDVDPISTENLYYPREPIIWSIVYSFRNVTVV